MKWTHRVSAVAALTLVAFTLGACQDRDDQAELDTVPPAADQTGVQAPADLQQEFDSFVAAWNQDDPNSVAMFFTDDATVTIPSGTFNGRDEIMQQWLQPNVAAISGMQTHDDTVEAAGQDYRSSGRYSMNITTPDGDATDEGRYDAHWTRAADNRWRIRSLNVTSDNPDAVAPQP